MPYGYFNMLATVFVVVFIIAFICSLWTSIETKRKKHRILTIVFFGLLCVTIVLSIWTRAKELDQEQGVEIERFTTDLDQVFLDYYRKSTIEKLNCEFKMVYDTDEEYITINKWEEFFTTKYIVIYHISKINSSNVIHLGELDEILDEKDMEG